MKTFIKWASLGLLFLGGITVFTIFTGDFEPTRLPITIIANLLGGTLLGLVFYLTETKYIPWRKEKLINKLSTIFGAKPISENITKFEFGQFVFLVHIEFKLSISEYGNAEIISFHIPRPIVDKQLIKPDFKYELDNCNGTQTYRVYQTNGLGLILARKRIYEKLNWS
jgi:hypothetical protein